jgi:hypothetical protein
MATLSAGVVISTPVAVVATLNRWAGRGSTTARLVRFGASPR